MTYLKKDELMISRRNLMISGALTLPIMLLGCETTQNAEITTKSFNVGKVKTYIKAGINAAKVILASISLIPSLSNYTTSLNTILAVVETKFDEFSLSVGDSLSVSYDNTSVQTIINSIINELDGLIYEISNIALKLLQETNILSKSDVDKIILTRDALTTIVSVFKTTIGAFISTASGSHSMSEQQALEILK